MLDRFGRTVNYLRLSVTDLCNFRCLYCMGPDGVEKLAHDEILRFEEIARIVRVLAGEGIRKVRLTGGEPLLRRGVIDLVRMIRSVPGIDVISMTTNGSMLARHASALKDAGLDRVNISIDSLDPDTFRTITRTGNLSAVMAGIEAADRAGLAPIKLNVVPMKGINDREVADFARLTLDKPWSIRFIEYMPTASNGQDRFVSASDTMERVRSLGRMEPVDTKPLDGPAQVFRLPGAKGRVGFITPVSEPFCANCNRVRLTSDGKLLACLASDKGVDVRNMLRDNATDEDLARAFHDCLGMKPRAHGAFNSVCMNRIGG